MSYTNQPFDDDDATIFGRALQYGAVEEIPIFTPEAVEVAKEYGIALKVVTADHLRHLFQESLMPPTSIIGAMYRAQMREAKMMVEQCDAIVKSQAARATAH